MIAQLIVLKDEVIAIYFQRFSVNMLFPAIIVVTILVCLFLIVRKFIHNTLRSKLIVAFLAVALIPLGVLLFLNNIAAQTQLVDSANQVLLAAASQTATKLDTFMETTRDTIRTEAHLPVLSKYLELPADQRRGSTLEAEAKVTLRFLSRKSSVSSYALLDHEGQTVLDTVASDIGLDRSDREYFRRSFEAGQVYYSRVEFSPVTGKASLYFSSPVHGTAGDVIGVLRTRYDATVLQELVAQSNGLAGPDSFAILFDENHIYQAHGTVPETLYKVVAPLDPTQLADLQVARRLPPNLPTEELLLNLADLEQNLVNATNQPFFTARDVTTDDKLEQVAVTPMRTQPWLVAFFQPREVFLAPIDAQTRVTVLATMAIITVVIVSAVWVSRRLARPIIDLTAIAQQVAEGNLKVQVTVESQDETGQLGKVFNSMTGQLRELVDSLEQRVADRTHSLGIVATLGERLNAILDPNDLLREVVNQVKQNFGYYHTHIYLFDASGKNLIIAAGTGSVDQEMRAGDHRIPLDSAKSLVARAARSGEIVMANNVQAIEDWVPNPLFPDTLAEVAVPIIQKGEVIGVLDVQENKISGLDENDANLLRSLANQVAVALQNARLFTETTQRATELETLSQVSRRLAAVLDAKQLITEVIEQISTAFNYYYMQIYLFDQERENLVLAGGSGETGQMLLARQHSLPRGRGLVGRAAEQNKIVLIPDVHRHIGVEVITQANLEEIYRREVDPAVEAEWYAKHIAQYFGDVRTLGSWPSADLDPTEKVLKIGYVTHVPGRFPLILRRGLEAAARDLQVEVELVSPVHEGEHLPLFEVMVRQGVDGLVVIPDQPSWVEPIRQAMAAGTPVVTANRDLNASPALMHVGLDNFQAGVILAHELIKLLETAGKREGKILLSTAIADRNAGVKHGLCDTNYTLIEIEGFVEDASFLNRYWEQAINRHPDVIAVIGLTVLDPPILAKIKRRIGGQWLLVGFDLEPATLEAVRDGLVQVTIGQHPYLQAYLPILGLVEHLRQGKSLQGWMAERWLPNALWPETKAEVAVPIVSGDQVLGVLDVHHNVAGVLKPENANLLRSVADQVAIALTNAHLFEETTQSKEAAEIAKEKAEQAREEAEQARREIEAANKALEIQVWQSTGQAQLNSKMRGGQDLGILANSIIQQLCHYLQVQIGALYLVEDHTLYLASRYAYSSKKSIEQFKFGEGLVGQVAVEKQPMIIANVPDNYITVRSGLGETVPKNIVLLPFVYNDRVMGVIELGTLTEFSPVQIEFIQTALDSIAIAFNTAQARARINELLIQTQRQAEELQAQGEELRAINEELEVQTESLRASETKLREKQVELEATNTRLEEQATALEESSQILREKQAILDKHNQELKVAQQELQKKAEELALASKYKSEFLANMSHELRTPLNSLLILARMLASNEEGNLTKDQIESAQIIYSGGKDLLNLINDILDLAKVESGKMSLNFEAMPLTDLLTMTQLQFGHVAEEKGLDLKLSLADDLPASIETDPQRIKQVIKNLLSNAFKFTTAGSVSLNIGRPETDVRLSRSDLDPSRTVAISVADTGIGIPLEQQKIIFEAFQQADGSTSRQYGGTGLGLSISRELATKLGGQIEVESEPGQGSTFTLYLPVGEKESEREEEAKAQMPQQVSSQPSSRPASQPDPQDDRAELKAGDKTLLIIEDDPKFAKILYDFAHKKAFKCLIAPDGSTGLTLVKTYEPEAIILDLHLPDISGWEVLQALKNDPATRHIPVHIISADDQILDAYRKGAMGYLTKPVSQVGLDESFHKIEQFIAREIKTLLLVEDDPHSRYSIKKLLGGSDIQISEAESGQTALDLLKTQHFDCVILDLGLPDMTGFEVLNKMNGHEAVTQCPVIVYTGGELTPEENLELTKYADSVIVKGVKSPERLLDETALFLHRVVADMPEDKQQTIKQLYNKNSQLKGKKILIVDDDMRNSFALSKLLSDKGITVRIAQNGQKALDLLAEELPDLVLMDIMMPVMDGYEATKHIRAQQQFKNLPILALTAKAMKGDQEKCLAAGVNDYLAKPIDVDRLFSMLRVWLYQ